MAKWEYAKYMLSLNNFLEGFVGDQIKKAWIKATFEPLLAFEHIETSEQENKKYNITLDFHTGMSDQHGEVEQKLFFNIS